MVFVRYVMSMLWLSESKFFIVSFNSLPVSIERNLCSSGSERKRKDCYNEHARRTIHSRQW